ncbi:His-Xaa-Ser system protein HxsD [Thiomonas sp. Bio17B3]|nr:His-Xaa-Ser system protein HxsD [Thiomonas sp. Bio17B3]
MLTLSFDAKLYEAESIQKAAYRFIDRLAAQIALVNSQIICELRSDKPLSQDQADRLRQDFNKEVLDQQLRLRIKRETEQERNLILSLAFSRTEFQSLE